MNSVNVNTRLLIGGAWQEGADRAAVVDKYRQETCWSVALPGPNEVNATVECAAAAHRLGPPSPHARGEILEKAAALVAGRREAFLRLMAIEAGFPKRDADGEVTRSIETLRLSAVVARQMKGEIIPLAGAAAGQGRFGFTIRVPVGPVVAITPFNSPLNTVTHKIAPAFAAGNPVILKPSLHTPATAALLVECLVDAGVPNGFLSLLNGGGDVAKLLLADDRVRFFTFTGSTAVGRSIQSAAGLRRTQMELGSIAPTIICQDADLDLALPKVVDACFRKAGQVCSSIQLLLVERSVFDRVASWISERADALRIGDPALASTDIGPLISRAAADRVESWIQEAVTGGARLLTQSGRDGACLRPAVLTGASPEMRLSCEEVFGPVVSLHPFDDFDAAIGYANRSQYGLAVGVFTRNLDVIKQAVTRLEFGGIHINETSSSRVDLMPYGGVKESGFGREGPSYTALEMTEERLVTMRL
jgi:acyl-CoA reductase-like NAD-dependent aldehyde dehydrogenase